jgi:hypothetical protein
MDGVEDKKQSQEYCEGRIRIEQGHSLEQIVPRLNEHHGDYALRGTWDDMLLEKVAQEHKYFARYSILRRIRYYTVYLDWSVTFISGKTWWCQ